MKTTKGSLLLAQVKKQQQKQQHADLTKLTKKKKHKTSFDKVNFNG